MENKAALPPERRQEGAGSTAGNMWCPECWQRFRWYVSVCPECQVELVEERPGPAPTPTAELVLVFAPLDGGLIAVAKSLLESETIDYLVRFDRLQDLFGCGRMGTGFNLFVGPAEIWVRADDAEHARARLEGLGSALPEGTVPSDDNA